jgi:hypothetical protein
MSCNVRNGAAGGLGATVPANVAAGLGRRDPRRSPEVMVAAREGRSEKSRTKGIQREKRRCGWVGCDHAGDRSRGACMAGSRRSPEAVVAAREGHSEKSRANVIQREKRRCGWAGCDRAGDDDGGAWTAGPAPPASAAGPLPPRAVPRFLAEGHAPRSGQARAPRGSVQSHPIPQPWPVARPKSVRAGRQTVCRSDVDHRIGRRSTQVRLQEN